MPAHQRVGRWGRLRLAIAGGVAVAVVGGAAALAAPTPWSDDAPPTDDIGDAVWPATPGGEDDGPGPGNGSHGDPPDVRDLTRGDFPDATTTGVPDGVELTPSGAMEVREDGAVIENLLIVDGEIEVYADDVTIRNVRITNDDQFIQWGIHQRSGHTGLVVEDSEIFGNTDSEHQFASAISNHGGMITVRRVEIHSITDGIVTRHGLIEENYLHSPRYFEGDHTDMFQANGGPADGLRLEIRGNTLINTEDQTSAVFLQNSTGHEEIPVQNVLVEGNLLAGGGYTVYGGGSVADGHDPADIVIRGNVFSREVWDNGGHWGPVAHFDQTAPGSEWSDNVWEDDGSEVRLDG